MDVGGWLRTLGFERYEAAFQQNGVDAEVLRHLTAEDLTGLGVVAVGHRRRLLVAIANLGDAPAQQAEDNPAVLSTAERRHITVLFCDIVGSTPLSAGLDPEELREILVGYQGKVAGAVTAEHGTIARFVGDGTSTPATWNNHSNIGL